jgi:hypothetical protein
MDSDGELIGSIETDVSSQDSEAVKVAEILIAAANAYQEHPESSR